MNGNLRISHLCLQRMSVPRHILPIIIFAQFAGTSLWFAGNAVLPDLISQYGFEVDDLGTVTSSVQLGFIVGTLVFAIFTIADKFSPSKIFFWCSILGAATNIIILFIPITLTNLVALRFIVGFLLAGIYPVGMKLSADWFQKDLGKALGFLVGALVIGTAFPHLIRGLGTSLDWSFILITVSGIATLGGTLILLFVPNGPYRKISIGFRPEAIFVLFRDKNLRSAAFGYFGHMWELYTVWAFIPIIIAYFNQNAQVSLNVSVLSFVAIGVGFFSCAIGGLMALKKGSAQIAFFQLAGSLLCISLILFIDFMPKEIFIMYLIFWGAMVIGDSPHFSTLAAKTAPPELLGSALTIMNSIGFALTIPSIYLANYLTITYGHPAILVFLALGPLFGLIFTKKLFSLA